MAHSIANQFHRYIAKDQTNKKQLFSIINQEQFLKGREDPILRTRYTGMMEELAQLTQESKKT
jgi:hypothetical protein